MNSFDIFDTLVTRTTYSPTGIFTLMEAFLCENCNKLSSHFCENFHNIRINGERECRRLKENTSEVTIFEIYRTIANYYHLTNDDINFLIQLELETERNNLVPIKSNLNKLKELVNFGEEVCLISEMYLNEAQLRYILQDVDPIFATIDIFVSCEAGVDKASGLFEYVFLKTEKLINTWVHFGDNQFADIQSAKKNGIDAIKVDLPDIMEYEKTLFDEESVASQLFIGASKVSRLNNIEQSIGFDIGASFGAPILFPFVVWATKECTKRGIKELFLLARDGYVLMPLFMQYIESMNYDIKVEYLYGSRNAWKIPNFDSDTFSYEKYFVDNTAYGEVKISSYARIIGIDFERFIPFLPEELCFKDATAEPHIIESIIKSNPKLEEEIINIFTKRKRNMRGYIEQEIGNSEKVAIVDMQGTSNTITYLADMIPEKTITMLYYKRTRDFSYKNCEFLTYSIGFDEVGTFVLEALSRADHGKTVGYDFVDGKYQAVLENDENSALIDYGYLDYLNGVKTAGISLSKNVMNCSFGVDWDKQSRRYIDYLKCKKDVTLLDWIGDMPFSDEQRGETIISKFAPKLTEEQVYNYYCNGDIDRSKYNSICLPFSIMRISEKERKNAYRIREKRIAESIKYDLNQNNGKQVAKKYSLKNVDALKDKRVVLYGAGTVGKQLYKQLCDCEKITIGLWADKEAFALRMRGLPVSRISDITDSNYDTIVIAIAREERAKAIMDELMSYGIDRSKMYWEDYSI